MIRIVIADDHLLIVAGLKKILGAEQGLKVVGEASDGLTAVKLVERLKPEVLLLDLGLPQLHGLDVIQQVRASSATRIVVVSMYGDEPHITSALQAGALGYVLKADGSEHLLNAIRAAANGESYLSVTIRKSALFAGTAVSKANEDPYERLTSRERTVLQHAAEGFSNSDIGRRLFISPRTVETHRASLMKKLHLSNQTELVRYAIRRKLITP